jgi:hypothetical protein
MKLGMIDYFFRGDIAISCVTPSLAPSDAQREELPHVNLMAESAAIEEQHES